jgi:hypothetical protein
MCTQFVSTEKDFRYDDTTVLSPDGMPSENNFAKTRLKKTSRHAPINELETKRDRMNERQF